MKKEDQVNQAKKANSFGLFLRHHKGSFAAMVFCMVMMMGMVAFAQTDDPAPVETLWSTLSDLIQTWVTRLGGVVMMVGGIMFGLGWKSDDAEQKSRGISTIIAGGIVAGIAALTGTFFA